MAGRVQPGDFEQGRGDLWQASRKLKWQVFLASKFGGLFSRVNPAGCYGKLFWRVILADYFGTFIQRVFMANGTSGFQRKKSKERKEKKMKGKKYILSESVNCIMIIVYCTKFVDLLV